MEFAQIYHSLYTSTSTSPLQPEAIQDILTTATANNKKHGITGLLIYRSGVFIQLLEGEESELEKLTKKIFLDSRHRDPKIVLKFQDQKRLFPHWSMGLISDDEEAETLTSFVKSLRSEEVKFQHNVREKVLEILKAFSKKYSTRR